MADKHNWNDNLVKNNTLKRISDINIGYPKESILLIRLLEISSFKKKNNP